MDLNVTYPSSVYEGRTRNKVQQIHKLSEINSISAVYTTFTIVTIVSYASDDKRLGVLRLLILWDSAELQEEGLLIRQM